nr:MAG TPA: hypothetical protein [Caudoviricetes sp.]
MGETNVLLAAEQRASLFRKWRSYKEQDSPHLSTMCPRGDICRCGGIGRRYK